MILGLGVASLWGIGDLLAAICARRLGTYATLAVAQITELVLCAALWAILRPPIDVQLNSTIAMLFIGVLTALSYGCLYRGLMLGPVSLVSPIAAAYAVGPTILAVVFLHERMTTFHAVGAAATILGVVVTTAADPRRDGQAARTRGIPFAFGAMVGFALSAFLIAMFAGSSGWLVPVLISRIGVAACLAITFFGIPRLGSDLLAVANERRSIPAAAAAAGACNLAGTALYAHSGEIGQVAIVSAVSALFPLVPIIGGLLMFHERLGNGQIAGIAMVVAGLMLLRPS